MPQLRKSSRAGAIIFGGILTRSASPHREGLVRDAGTKCLGQAASVDDSVKVPVVRTGMLTVTMRLSPTVASW